MLIEETSFSQERVNYQLPKIGKVVLGKLETATGYVYNPEGQWISRKNRIPTYIENQFKSLIDYEAYGLGIDNFIQYQIREITINQEHWIILLKKYRSGYYRYRSIQKGWTPHNSISYFVFSKEDFNSISTFQNSEQQFFKVKLYVDGTIDLLNEATYISDIEKAVGKSVKDEIKSKNEIVFQFALYKQKKIAQFQIYSWDTELQYPLVRMEYKVSKKGSESLADEESVYYTEKLLQYCYFEADYSAFVSFLNLK